jgi:hypothetical protein
MTQQKGFWLVRPLLMQTKDKQFLSRFAKRLVLCPTNDLNKKDSQNRLMLIKAIEIYEIKKGT